MSTVAVIITAFNEDDVLGRCLEAARGLGELLVSVDRATTDQTAEVAAQAGAKVLFHTGLPAEPPEQDHEDSQQALNSYARMRNEVLDQAAQQTQAEWLLWLDADEIVQSGQEVALTRLAEVPNDCAAMAITMELYTNGVLHSSMQNTKFIRRDVRFVRRRHEHIDTTQKQMLCAEFVVAHHPQQRPEVRQEHDRRKLQLQAFNGDWQEFGDGRAAFYLADWWRQQNQVEVALRWYDAGLSLPQSKCQPYQRAMLAAYAGKLYLQVNQPEQARRCYFVAVENEWRLAEAYYYLGGIAANLRRFDEAKFWLNAALNLRGVCPPIIQQEVGCDHDLPLYALACVAHEEGFRQEAYRLLLEAEQAAPSEREQFAALRRRLDEQ